VWGAMPAEFNNTSEKHIRPYAAVNLVELNLTSNLIDKIAGLGSCKALRKVHLTAGACTRPLSQLNLSRF